MGISYSVNMNCGAGQGVFGECAVWLYAIVVIVLKVNPISGVDSLQQKAFIYPLFFCEQSVASAYR